MKTADLTGELFDLLVNRPEGVTKPVISDALQISISHTDVIIRGLRDLLGGDDSINVTADPSPDDPRGYWVYRLVATVDEASPWVGNRVVDAERRVTTLLQMARSAARNTDGRSREGKRARLMTRYFTRLLEDLQDIEVA